MSERQWTPEQQQCIEATGGTLLVSAAAGSGKTSVLVQRVIRRITRQENPTSVDRLLVVTFTKAAAAEMKQRMAAELSRLIAEHPEDLRLQKQQMLLPRASISTVDSFCANLVREHFHQLDVSPQFKVAEEAETRLLRDEALSEVIEACYQEGNPDFLELTAMLSTGKSDRRLAEDVEKIYNFIQSHPDPEAWLTEKEQAYITGVPIRDTVWGRLVTEHILSTLRQCLSMTRTAISLCEPDEVLAVKYLPALQMDRQTLTHLLDRLSAQDLGWDDMRALLGSVAWMDLDPVRKCPDPTAKARVQALRAEVKDCVAPLSSLLCGTEEQCQEDLRVLQRLTSALFQVVRRYSARFSELKKKRRMLDFSDLEHKALELLVLRGEDGQFRPTPLARELSAQYDEILVDEYQDTNAAQDALFLALSRNGENLFMVGDVKQSIYGFRQAMPELFIRRRDSYPDFDGETYPATITLGNNFRSRLTVTDSVNFLFRQLMTREAGGISYDDREALVPSADYPEGEGYETELLIIDDRNRDKASEDKDTLEARAIARRIKELTGHLPVGGRDRQRPARYGDFCILLRSKNSHAPAYVAELNRCGVPAVTDSDKGFFGTPEVSLTLSLLRFIDNPVQDIPLLSVLLSPVFGFLPDDLAAIRLLDRKSNLYTALTRMARQKEGEYGLLPGRCRDFLEQTARWRTLGSVLPADNLIHRLYEDTGLTAVMSARRDGAQRAANLRLLHDYARRFEHNGFRGLSAFIRYIDRLEAQGMDLSPAEPAGSTHADAVQVVSIHHSKGLEYPVVFLAGLGGQFNRQSIQEDLLLHQELGAGFRRRDPETFNRFETLPWRGVSLAIRRSERAEELRVLYVALTRAREKLCMVMTQANPEKKLAGLAAVLGEEEQLSPFMVLDASGIGDWVLSAALRHPSGKLLRQLAGNEEVSIRPADTPWKVDVVCAPPSEESESAPTAKALPDRALMELISEHMAFAYPYAPLSMVPSKLAASEVSHEGLRREFVAARRPAFLSESGLTPAEKGTALHTYMQFARYETAEVHPEEETARLVLNRFLTVQQGESLDYRKIRTFFASPLYRRIRASSRCLREVHFTVDQPVDAFLPETLPDNSPDFSQESLVVQGIADCVFEENGELVIVDYKTDRVKSPSELVQRYRGQLQIYARALTQTLGRPIRECLLYSFHLGREIPVNF